MYRKKLLNSLSSLLSLSCLVLLSVTAGWSMQASGADLQVALPEPEWLLLPVRNPLSQREAQIDASEVPLTNTLWPLVEAGDYLQAIAILEEAMAEEAEEDAENPYVVFSAALNHLQGQLYLQEEQYDKAEMALREALVKLPTYVRAHQALGFVYLLQENYEQARVHIVEAASLGGDDAQLFGYLGYLNQQTGNYWGAISAYQRALMLDGDNTQWGQGLLFCLVQAGQYASAITYIDDLLLENPDDPRVWLYRAHAALQMDDDMTALTSLEAAIRLGESQASNLQLAARTHLNTGSLARAVELQKSSLDADFHFDYLNQTLSWLLREEEWPYAQELIDRGRQQWDQLDDTQKSRLLDSEAYVAEALDSGQTLALLEEALELDPGNAEALLHLARLYAEDQRYVQAELLYQRASAYEDSRERALLGQAQLAIDQFAYERAMELLQQVLSSNPNYPNLRQNILILENLVNTSQNSDLLLSP